MISRSILLEHLELTDTTLVDDSMIHTYAVVIAGVFVLMSLALSSFLMFEHLTSYKDPEEQKWLIGIIFMVPVYTVSSFLSLWHPDLSLACNILGNCYEAYALYSFGSFLIACLGGEDRVIQLFEREGKTGPRTPLLEDKSNPGNKERRAAVEHPVPLSWCMDPWELGQDFYSAAKFGIVQYMILKTFCAILALVMDCFGLYDEGNFNIGNSYPYITLVLNFSQTWALYCLIQFYAQTHEELKAINPLAKFVCFKSIVFATWWQGVVLSLVFSSGWMEDKFGPDEFSGARFQSFLQNFLICFEMAIAAIAHIYIFPATPYQLMGHGRRRGSVKVLTDYAAIDSPLDPEEVRESEKPAVIKFPNKDDQRRREATSLRESVQEVIVVGGGHVVQDMRLTVHQAVEPMEKGLTKFNETFGQLPWAKHRKKEEKKVTMVKDDSWLSSSTVRAQAIKGIDDPLLSGSVSDSGIVRKKSISYGSGAESSGESSDQGTGAFKTRGQRWTIKM
ncbi:unnamed protein product [Calypogeia fissa]